MLFFFNDTATTEIYTLSLHDALPICSLPSTSPRKTMRSPGRPTAIAYRIDTAPGPRDGAMFCGNSFAYWTPESLQQDRKSTRLNSSHANISYAVFCLKKKTNYASIIP